MSEKAAAETPAEKPAADKPAMESGTRRTGVWTILILIVLAAGGAAFAALRWSGGEASSDPSDDWKLIAVSGVVTLNGEPLSNADVSFMVPNPTQVQDSYYGGTALTDEQGRYSVEVQEGEYKVAISKYTDLEGKPVEEDDPNLGGRDEVQLMMEGLLLQVVPLDYSDSSRTELTASVTADKTTGYDFELTGEGPGPQDPIDF